MSANQETPLEFSNQNPLSFLLEQLGETNPKMKMLTELIKKQQATQSEANQASQGPNESENSEPKHVHMRQENELLRQENLLLVERIEALAAALGACPECWGENEDCELCRGRGTPGSMQPDRDMFRAYVVPVLEKLRRIGERKRRAYRENDVATATKPGSHETTNL